MSRTLGHIRYKHWNVKEPRVYAYPQWNAHNGLEEGEATLGVVLCDLRFYAGCKRTPQFIRRERTEYSYRKTWGHHGGGMAAWAKIRHRNRRANERTYTQTVVKLVSAGEEYEDLIEPEGRTRHSAFYDAW